MCASCDVCEFICCCRNTSDNTAYHIAEVAPRRDLRFQLQLSKPSSNLPRARPAEDCQFDTDDLQLRVSRENGLISNVLCANALQLSGPKAHACISISHPFRRDREKNVLINISQEA